MEKYIKQLVSSIEHAHRIPEKSEKKDEDLTFEEQMEAVERWATGEGTPLTLAAMTGLEIGQFPPPEKLTEAEMKEIMAAFQELLGSFNMCADFPDTLPVSKAYPLMISLLNEEAWYLPGGTLCKDFCTGYAPECKLEEYCPCLQYWNQSEEE